MPVLWCRCCGAGALTSLVILFFFFQAEDGIRDLIVTGVQTCALPILLATSNSFHATSDREVVNWYAPDRIARMTAEVERSENEVKIEIVIIDSTPSNSSVGAQYMAPNSPERQRKRIKINSVPKKAVDLIGQVTI